MSIDLTSVHLAKGAHDNPDAGYCLLEWVSMLAGAPFSDAPPCVSPYLRRFGIRLNDLANDVQRQDLVQFGPRVLNTAGDGLDERRRWLGADHAVRVATPRWLEKAGLTGHAAALRAVAPIVDRATYDASRSAVNAARDAAYQARRAVYGGKSRYGYIYSAVKAKLTESKPAAVDDAAADAAAAAADAANSTRRQEIREAVYKAVRALYEERYGDLMGQSWADAVALFDRLIDPEVSL